MKKEFDSNSDIIKKLSFYSSDMDGSNNECVYSKENVSTSFMYRDSLYRYIVLEEDRKDYLIVLSYDGKEVLKIDSSDMFPVWSDQKDILFMQSNCTDYVLCNIETGKLTEVSGSTK